MFRIENGQLFLFHIPTAGYRLLTADCRPWPADGRLLTADCGLWTERKPGKYSLCKRPEFQLIKELFQLFPVGWTHDKLFFLQVYRNIEDDGGELF